MKTNPFAILKLDAKAVAKMDGVSLKDEIDRRVRRVFKLTKSDSEIVRAAAYEALQQYSDEQKALFASKGQLESRALRSAIVAAERDDGTVVYRIVPRGMCLDNVDQEANATQSGGYQGYSKQLGLSHELRRGKYNDAGLLIDQSTASVDPSEVVPFAHLD